MKLVVAPTLGVARFGNSPAYFEPDLTQEGTWRPAQNTSLRDAHGRLKRQACTFGVYVNLHMGEPSWGWQEVIHPVAHVEWTVQVANRKASLPFVTPTGGHESGGFPEESIVPLGSPRNLEVPTSSPLRSLLDIAPPPVSVSGLSQPSKPIEGTIRFPSQPVTDPGDLASTDFWLETARTVRLGEVETDAYGRLRFLPGTGRAEHVPYFDDAPLKPVVLDLSANQIPSTLPTLNSSRWLDDACDGWVRARVVFLTDNPPHWFLGEQVHAVPAWVVSAPPRFFPGGATIISAYDDIRLTQAERGPAELMVRLGLVGVPSYRREILPLLQAAQDVRWTTREWSTMQAATSPTASPHWSLTAAIASPYNAGQAPANASGACEQGKNRGTIHKSMRRALWAWPSGRSLPWEGYSSDWPPCYESGKPSQQLMPLLGLSPGFGEIQSRMILLWVEEMFTKDAGIVGGSCACQPPTTWEFRTRGRV